MSDLVGNPEHRFSRVAAQFIVSLSQRFGYIVLFIIIYLFVRDDSLTS